MRVNEVNEVNNDLVSSAIDLGDEGPVFVA